MNRIQTDVLIVGSGFGAAAPALRLAEAGLAVLVVEKGRRVEAPRDFRQTQDPDYVRRYLKGLEGDNIGMTYAEGLGGGSGFYEAISLRAPTIAFDQTDEDGRRYWPASIDRAAFDPYYDIAESMLGVRQIPTRRIPKTGLVFARLMKELGLSCDRAPYAIRSCQGSGFCITGCVYGSKKSLHLNYIPAAEECGARFVTDTRVTSLRRVRADEAVVATDAAFGLPPHRLEARCTSGDGDRLPNIRARWVVLAGGTVGTADVLLRSTGSLPGLSPAVGERVAFNGSVKTVGLLPDDSPDGDMFTGQTHPGMISYEFLESHGVTIAAAKPLPLQTLAAAMLRMDGDGRRPRHWGQAHMDLMKVFRRRALVLYALGMTAPTARMSLQRGELRLSLRITPELRDYYTRTRRLIHSLFERTGGRPLDVEFVDSEGAGREDIFYSTAHQVGSAPMSDSKSLGVVDASGEAHGVPGLYVTDGAAIPTSLAVNTSLTILANAERIAAGIVEGLSPTRPELHRPAAGTRSTG